MNENTKKFMCERLSDLLNVDIFCEMNNVVKKYGENPAGNPLYVSETLRNTIRAGAGGEPDGNPYIYIDRHNVCFGCIMDGETRYYYGPISLEMQDKVHLHYFYRDYGVDVSEEKKLKRYTFVETVKMTQLIAAVLLDKTYTMEQISHDSFRQENEQLEKDEIRSQIFTEEEELYHHTFMEERQLLDCVREGDVEEAVKRSQNMDSQLGKLSTNESNHWKNVCIVAITLCTRAAIDSGVSPYIAYQISDFYIQKCDESRDVLQSMKYRNQAVRRITSEVRKKLEQKHTSNYVEQCKNYIGKHYREKIYLDDVASILGVSGTYLSHLFKKETGMCFQDYITLVRVERASNLLIYSDESIPRIAEYVNFPSQSYFGRVFKKYKQTTPLKYRQLHKPGQF